MMQGIRLVVPLIEYFKAHELEFIFFAKILFLMVIILAYYFFFIYLWDFLELGTPTKKRLRNVIVAIMIVVILFVDFNPTTLKILVPIPFIGIGIIDYIENKRLKAGIKERKSTVL